MLEIMKLIDEATSDEFHRINTPSLKFHSPHEAWAILLEEIEEAEEDLRMVKELMNGLKYEVFTDLEDKKTAKVLLSDIASYAKLCSAEVVQVSAVAKKFFELVSSYETM